MSEASLTRAYLDQLKGEGAFDSSGTFTVGEKVALEKLGAFQLPRDSAWVLKIVQAAVCWGASEIDVKQGRNRTSFAFSGTGSLDLESVQYALTSTEPSSCDVVGHLVVGLRAVGFGQWRNFEFHVFDRKSHRSLQWDGESLSSRVEESRNKPKSCVVEIGVDFTVPSGRFGRSRATVEEAAKESVELSTKASVCPIPLKLDGRRLDVLNPPEEYLPTPRVAQICLAWSEPTEGEILALPGGAKLKEPMFSIGNRLIDNRIYSIQGNKNDRDSESLLQLSYHYDISWKDPQGYYSVEGSELQTSWLHAVSDGVVCDSTPLGKASSRIRLDLYFSGRGLPTDISGLALIQKGRELARRRQRSLEFARCSINKLEAKLSRHQGPFLRLGGALGLGLFGLMKIPTAPVILGGLIMGGVIFSPAFIMGGIELGRANQLMKLLVKDCRSELLIILGQIESEVPKRKSRVLGASSDGRSVGD